MSDRLDTVLKMEEDREKLALEIEHASLLEARHRENEKAIQLLQGHSGQSLVCLGKSAFIKLPVKSVQVVLKSENDRVWTEVESLQRNITKFARELEEQEGELNAQKPTD